MADGAGAVRTQDWRVEGMDCGSCAVKLRGALERLPGVETVEVSVIAGSMRLMRGAGGPDDDAVMKAAAALGYRARPRDGAGPEGGGPAGGATHDHDRGHDHDDEADDDRAWWESGKGRLVLATGALIAVAWAVKLAAPGLGPWPFIAACLLGVAPVARRAWAAARAGQVFTIEALMTVAAVAALTIDAAAEAALVVFLFAAGEVLEGVAAGRARRGVRALAALQPRTARVEEGGALREKSAAEVRVGDIVLVRPGERIPADGDIVDGISGVDESPVTGESVPVTRGPGEGVFAGAIVAEAALRIRATRPPEDNTIARIIRLVEEAESARAPTERFIDRFSRIYMPVIVALAVLVAVLPPLLAGQPWETWIYRAVALLLIGCPCALVISVPASVASGLSAGARRGLLMKGGAVIEAIADVTHVAFDKTGTLTRGKPVVTDVAGLSADAAEALALAAAVEAGSGHPLAAAIRDRAAQDGVTTRDASGARALAGRGVAATMDGREAFVAAPRFAREEGALDEAAAARVAALEAEGKTVAVVFADGAALGLIALRDEPRADAADAVRQLRALGVGATMLTGDNARAADAVGRALGVEVQAELRPEDKVAAVRGIAETQKLMMVGDGVNDAPALAAAHVGVAMGGGTDVALETAQAALLRDRVTDVAAQIRLARATMANIRQNITFALGLKAVFLVTSVLGITGLWIAILADTGATVLVTANALRLLAFNPEKKT